MFTKFEDINRHEVWVNTEKVTTVREYGPNSIISVGGSREDIVTVKLTPTQVMQILGQH